MTWKEVLDVYDEIVSFSDRYERKGKTVPYTSANGYMFSFINKDGQLGIRLSKEQGREFNETVNSEEFKSHGAVMKGYVVIPQNMLNDKEKVFALLNDGYEYVMSLKPK